MKKLLLSLLLCTSIAFGFVEFRYERDMLFMYDAPQDYTAVEKQRIIEQVSRWIQELGNDYAHGRIQLTRRDVEYIERIIFIALELQVSEKNDLEDLFR